MCCFPASIHAAYRAILTAPIEIGRQETAPPRGHRPCRSLEIVRREACPRLNRFKLKEKVRLVGFRPGMQSTIGDISFLL